MPFASSHSTNPDLQAALDGICAEISHGLQSAAPDLAFLFVSHSHSGGFESLARQVYEKTGANVLLGCTGETIVGGHNEIESGPAASMWAATLGDVQIEPFHVQFARAADGIVCEGFPTPDDDKSSEVRAVFLFGEPYSSAPNLVLDHFAEEFAGVPVMGGMASGGAGPGTNRLFVNDQTVEFGAVGAVIYGGPQIRSVVSQGCRPIGTHYIVTKADQNIIHELGGVPPLARLRELLPKLPQHDQQLLRHGLHVGIVMNEYQASFARGDFLISNVMGADQDDGSIAIGNSIRVGQTVQFHVRDAATADEDLNQLLDADKLAHATAPRAALLFSCNGRGTRLFEEPNHDAGTILQKCGPIPVAGFFAQGEIGPVGGKNHIHGFTASIALFE